MKRREESPPYPHDFGGVTFKKTFGEENGIYHREK